jgi:hypothetical protein
MIDDDELRERLETLQPQRNPSRRTKDSTGPSARRGTQEFEDLMDEVEDEWELEDDELDNIVEVRRSGDSFEIRLKGEDRWELLEDDEDEDSGDGDSVAGRGEDSGEGEEE